MTPRLPPVLSSDDLPLVELQCAALDGELFALDHCFCPIDEFDTVHLRARALAVVLDPRIIAERMTAAWVWGATLNPPARHELCVAIGARTRPNADLNAILREVVITPDDIDTVSGVGVTSRLRTVLDLARFSDPFGPRERNAVAVLMNDGGFGLQECAEALNSRRNLPQKRLALLRLSSLHNSAPVA